jgi:SAM-dependent methyltransferase
MTGDTAARFTDRVGDYARARPSYPPAVLDALRDEMGLCPEHVVADVGSGTGILAEMLLARGHVVYGVEPNREMARAAAHLAATGRFHDVDGRAEATGLPDRSVDLVTAAQAFHWFPPAPSRAEFLRILRPPGRVAVVWNLRRVSGTPFLEAFEALLHEWSTDYREVSATYADPGALATLFGGPTWSRRRFTNGQSLDHEGLERRLRSSSYTPPPGHPRHAPMLEALRALFFRHAQDGRVRVDYDTDLYFGTLLP